MRFPFSVRHMGRVKFLTLALNVLVFSSSASAAFLTASLAPKSGGLETKSYVVIAGKGLEVSDQFLKIAHTQALIYQDKNPSAKVYLIAGIDKDNAAHLVGRWGYKHTRVYKEDFTATRLINLIGTLKSISGIDFYGHNGAFRGLALEDYENRLYTKEIPALKAAIGAKLEKDAVIRLYGCNTGYILAPLLAKELNRPALGTYTFADTQRILDNGLWYYNDTGRYPEGHSFIGENAISFNQPLSCISGGGCYRLKVVNTNYQGTHGNYGGTVPFLKVHCGNLKTETCASIVAKSTLNLIPSEPLLVSSQVKPTLAQFAAHVSDQFCGSWVDLEKRADCNSKVQDHLLGRSQLNINFTTTTSPTLQCDLRGCQFQKNCSSGTCVFESTGPKKTTTYVDELNFYKMGFERW